MVLLVLFSIFFLCFFRQMWFAIWWSFFWGKFVLLSWQLPRSAAHQWCHHLLAINPCNYPRSETSKWVFQMGVSFFFQLLGWVGGLGLELGWGWGIVTIVEISTSCVFFLEWTLIHLHVMGQAMILWCVLCCCIFLLNNCILQARQKDWNIFARRPPLQRKPTKRQTRNVRNPVAKYPVIMFKIQVSQMFFRRGNAICWYRITPCHWVPLSWLLGRSFGCSEVDLFWRSVGRSKQGGWNWLASRRLSTPRLLPAALLFAPWARCLL